MMDTSVFGSTCLLTTPRHPKPPQKNSTHSYQDDTHSAFDVNAQIDELTGVSDVSNQHVLAIMSFSFASLSRHCTLRA